MGLLRFIGRALFSDPSPDEEIQQIDQRLAMLRRSLKDFREHEFDPGRPRYKQPSITGGRMEDEIDHLEQRREQLIESLS